MWREMPQNHIQLFTSNKSKWFSRGFSLRSVREAEYGTTASQTPLLSYRPNNVQRAPWCTISFSLFLFCFPFLLLLLTHSCPSQQRVETGGMVFFPPTFMSIGSVGGGDTYTWGPGTRKEEGEEILRRTWDNFSGKAEKEWKAEWLLLWRACVSHLTQQEEGRAGDKCSGASPTYFLWFLLRSYKQYCMTAKSKRTNTHTHLSFCTAVNEGAGLKMMTHQHHLGLDFYKLHIQLQ